MKKLILLIGIPGSGKTTLALKLFEKGFQRISADDIRCELYGDAAIQGNSPEVFKIFFERLEKLFEDGLDVVVDNTNRNFKQRQPILDRAKAAGYADIRLWLLDVPLATCLQRNAKRERTVPEEIVTSYYNQLRKERPSRTEGELVILRPDKEGSELLFFPQA